MFNKEREQEIMSILKTTNGLAQSNNFATLCLPVNQAFAEI